MKRINCSARVTRKSAFSLVELLIVLAIISILAAILFPVFSRLRENARRASCASNLKQIGLALTLYAQDNDGRLPRRLATETFTDYGNGNSSISMSERWSDELNYSYVKNDQIWKCPSNTLIVHPERVAYVCNGADNLSASSAESIDVGGGTTPMRQPGDAAIASIASAAQTVLVTEQDPPGLYTCAPISGAHFSTAMFKGHLGTVNFLFADGHVKALKPTATGAPINMWNIEDNVGDANANLMRQLQKWQDKVESN